MVQLLISMSLCKLFIFLVSWLPHLYKQYLGLGNLFFFFFSFLFFLWLHLRHMEVLRLEVESALQLQVYTTSMATWALSHICDLHCSLWQSRILNPLREARDQTCIPTEAMSVLNLLSHNRSWQSREHQLDNACKVRITGVFFT